MIIELEVNGIPVRVGKEEGQEPEISDLWMEEINKITQIASIVGGSWVMHCSHIGDNDLHRDGGRTEGGITVSVKREYPNTNRAGRPEYWKLEVKGVYPERPDGSHWLVPDNPPRRTISIADPFRVGTQFRSMLPEIERATFDVRKKIADILEERARYREAAERIAEIGGIKLRNTFDVTNSEAGISIPVWGGLDIDTKFYRSSPNSINVKIDGLTLAEIEQVRDLLHNMRSRVQTKLDL